METNAVKSGKAGRIILSDTANSQVRKMLDALKKDHPTHLKINPSKLVSWIVERYQNTAFEKDIKLIAKDHFNSREYFRQVIHSIESKEDVTKALSEALSHFKSNERQPTRRRSKKMSPPPSQSSGIEAT